MIPGLGIRLVLVIGAQPLIDSLLRQRNLQPAWVGGYRVTNRGALQAAVEAAGQVRINCEQYLSKVGENGGVGVGEGWVRMGV